MFKVWNETDGILASPGGFKTRQAAEVFIKTFRKRFEIQGYYQTAGGERITPAEVNLVVRPTK